MIDRDRHPNEPGTTVLALVDGEPVALAMSRAPGDPEEAQSVYLSFCAPNGARFALTMTQQRAVEFASAIVAAVASTGADDDQIKAWADGYFRASCEEQAA